MNVRARAALVVDGENITHRQLVALSALKRRGSMKKAAEELGISTPVLYKYIREVEAKIGVSLVESNSKGSKLTVQGMELIDRFASYEKRLDDQPQLKVAGTLVSESCLLTAATALSKKGIDCSIWISTDDENLRMADQGIMDCMVLDDALFAMERSQEVVGTEVGSDLLLHRDSGPRYLNLAFGAQRLGFRHLEEKKVEHQVVFKVFEPAMLDYTELSYFVNRSLVRRGIVKAEDATEQRWSIHSIMAIPFSDHADVAAFIDEARRAGLYPKG